MSIVTNSTRAPPDSNGYGGSSLNSFQPTEPRLVVDAWDSDSPKRADGTLFIVYSEVTMVSCICNFLVLFLHWSIWLPWSCYVGVAFLPQCIKPEEEGLLNVLCKLFVLYFELKNLTVPLMIAPYITVILNMKRMVNV